ncbi:hypothetical protein IGB42_01424 [Andreprevotia sp. IGB-42]|uniref:ABC transporter permease n=1 Tax=Andreprevotia sp. IGB-42 TaxID=2497473 RepID=UPI00135AC86B|nr:ABC-2 family transporter protein [Andreprevotia sp. IGB-42]KAF0813745.1 hypothetical protein IGB42_01424 [Andreprevotia sp. IGB-42]
MKRYYTLFSRLVIADTKAKLADRADFFLIMLGIASTTLTSAATVWLLAGSTGQIAGWDRGGLIFMQGLMIVSYSLQSACFNAQYWLETWLKDGNFLRFYLRPIHPVVLLSLERFHPQGIPLFMVGIAYCVFGAQHYAAVHAWWFIPAFIVLAALSALIYLAINLIAAGSAFWMGDTFPVLMTTGRLTEMARYPVDIFPALGRAVFQVLPLAVLAYWPAQALLKDTSLPATLVGMTLFAATGLWLLDRMWKAGMRRYEGAGG